MHSKNQRRPCSVSTSRVPLVPVKAPVSVSVAQSDADPVLTFRVPREHTHSRFSKQPLAVYPPKGACSKTCVSLPVVSLEKMSCFSRSEAPLIKLNSTPPTPPGSSLSLSSSSSSPSSSAPRRSPVPQKFLNGRSNTPPSMIDRRPSPAKSPFKISPSPSPQERRPAASKSPSRLERRQTALTAPPDRKQQTGAKGGRHRKVSGRVFDPNKHCGVLDPETKRPCTRSLTCKTHSLSHRRAVSGRQKDFDILLAEHKGRAKEELLKKELQAANQSEQVSHDAAPSFSASCVNGRTTPIVKLRLGNSHLHKVSGTDALISVPAPPPPALPPHESVPVWQKTSAESQVSSDEGETDLSEDPERPLYPYSTQHPRALSCCAFSSRVMGRGHYVFDRRWDRIRLALHCMVEKHLNSLMWRKVPLAVESTGYIPNHSLFCIRDPEPGDLRSKQTKPIKNECHRKRREPGDLGVSGKNGNFGTNSIHLPSLISNGTGLLSFQVKPHLDGHGAMEQDLGCSEVRKRKRDSRWSDQTDCKSSRCSSAKDETVRGKSRVDNTLSRQHRLPH